MAARRNELHNFVVNAAYGIKMYLAYGCFEFLVNNFLFRIFKVVY